MATKFRIHETLENAFIAGLLLTGSVERAENAILESVRISCPDDLFSEALFRRVVHYSIDPRGEISVDQEKEIDRAESILPFELRCVLALPQNLRYCYVLRILVGLSREVCAWLLHMDTSQVEQYTCSAMLELPLIHQRHKLFAEINAEKTIYKEPPSVPSNIWRLSRTGSYDQKTPAALFRSTKVIQFEKPSENS